MNTDTLTSKNLNVSARTLAKAKWKLSESLGNLSVAGKRILEIGSGEGLTSLLIAASGAKHVIACEPESEGSTSGMMARALDRQKKTNLTNLEFIPRKIEDTGLVASGKFDIILAMNVINHIDEDACRTLHTHDRSRSVYKEALRGWMRMLAPNGTLVITDCSRHNLFSTPSSKGWFKSPFARSIEWDIHQSPHVWQSIFADIGIHKTEVHWNTVYRLRHLSPLLGNAVGAYMTTSSFTLRAYC